MFTRLKALGAAALIAAAIVSFPVIGAEGDKAGEVVKLQATAMAVQDAVPRALKVGDPIFVGDVLSTGRDSRLEIRMIDGAVMTLGERASFVVIDYVFRDNVGNAAMRLMSGALLAASGEIAKLSGNPFTVATEVATVGVRGTTFWGGVIDGAWSIALLDGRGIYVENAAGRVEITGIEDGTTIRGANVVPTQPQKWATDKLNRAKETVRFR